MHSARFPRPSASLPLGLLLMLGIACASTAGSRDRGDASAKPPRRELWTFTAFWDARSARSLAQHGTTIDAAITTWIALDTAAGLPAVLHADPVRRSRVPARRMALVTSWVTDRFHPESVRRLAADPAQLARAAGTIAGAMAAGGQRGAVLDFEAHDAADLPLLLATIRAVADTLHARRLGPVVVAIPATDTAAYPARAILDAGADLVMPMLYDQHWSTGAPGAVASPAWVAAALATRVKEAGVERIVAALPLYGYRWPAAGGTATTVTFDEARQAAAAAGTRLERDSVTGSLQATLPQGAKLWVTDAVLLQRLLAVVERAGVGRVALWHIGQEDPGVWSVLRRRSRR